MRYSTDQSRFQQNMNQFNFQAGWRWLQVSAGDVSPVFNPYSLRGTRVRGGHIELNPGSFRAQFTAGQVNRRVTNSESERFRQPAYERWLYGARLGFGAERGSHFHLGIVYAVDNDELTGLSEPVGGQGSARPIPAPQENLTLSPDFQLSLFSRRVHFQAQNTVSVYTRDTRSESFELSDIGLPNFFDNLYTPRSSTRVNYATNISTRFNFNPLTLNVGFERVQPGFRSLGLRNIKDDDQTIRVDPSLSLLNGRLNFAVTTRFGRDNLLDQRVSTQRRQDLGLNIQTQLTNQFSLGMGYNRFQNKVESAATSESEINYPEQTIVSQSINLQPVFTWMGDRTTNSISVSGNYQLLDVNIDQSDMDMNSTSFTAASAYNMSFFSGLNFNTNFNFARGDSRNTTFSVYGINVGGGHSLFSRRLNLNLNAGFSRTENESNFNEQTIRRAQQQLTGNFTATFRTTTTNTIRLNARTITNALLEGTGAGFREFELRLSIDQRF
ncbi:MAG: hypothetical protein JJU35_05485 [Balneolales bacterium]|nr:hypothetical protein [Balneolales bacterium]